MRRRFPEAELVVHGHWHIPYDGVEGGLRLVNPGSPTDRRRQPVCTYGELDPADDAIVRHESTTLYAAAPPGDTTRVWCSGLACSTLGRLTRKWRNGRRAVFRWQCPYGRGGSNPPLRTTG